MQETMAQASSEPSGVINSELVRPALLGLIDGAVSTLAPIFAAAQMTSSIHVFIVGVAAATGAGLSMGLAEALSHRSDETNQVAPWLKGVYTGSGTVAGGMFHTLPFLIPNIGLALALAYIIVGIELGGISILRYKYLGFPLGQTVVLVVGGGALVFFLGIFLGTLVK